MMLPRLRFLQRAAALGTAIGGRPAGAADAPPGPLAAVEFTPAAEARGRAEAARPSRGGLIPADLPRRLGIAHVDPKYGFTSKPILIEGAEKILETPARAAKFWLLDLSGVYRMNSDWQPLRGDADFVERIKHPYFAATLALPHATVDLVSWSCYDGINDPALAWKCLEVLHGCVRDEGGRPAPIVIGEIGRPETGQEEQAIVEWWDQALGVLFAWGVHSIFHWELFCNEPRDARRRHLDLGPHVQPDEMRGFWWFRPDGTTSWGGDYLGRVLTRAGQHGLG